MLQTKKERALFSLVIGAGYLVLFLFHYIFSTLDTPDAAVEIVSYIIYLLICALSAISAYVFHRMKEEGGFAYLHFLLFLSMRLFYQIPYYCVYYISDAYTTVDAIILGVLMGLVDLICWYAVFAAVSFFLTRFGAHGERGALGIALCFPLYEFILLLVEVVLYMTQNSGLIFTEDILYFVFGFIYPALILTASYVPMLFVPKLLKPTSTKGD